MAERDYHKLVYVWGSQLVLDTMDRYNTENRTIAQKYEKKREIHNMFRFSIDTCIEYTIKIVIGMSIFAATASVGSMAMDDSIITQTFRIHFQSGQLKTKIRRQ